MLGVTDESRREKFAEVTPFLYRCAGNQFAASPDHAAIEDGYFGPIFLYSKKLDHYSTMATFYEILYTAYAPMPGRGKKHAEIWYKLQPLINLMVQMAKQCSRIPPADMILLFQELADSNFDRLTKEGIALKCFKILDMVGEAEAAPLIGIELIS